VDGSGALHAQGAPGALRSRPIHITGDASGRHLLVAYNDPSSLSVHTINADGSVGVEVPQAAGLDTGIYGHQIRVMPSNKGVILVTRGNQPTASTREDPGAVKVFRYDEGKLTNRASIAPGKGIGMSKTGTIDLTQPFVKSLVAKLDKAEAQRDQLKAALRKIELLPLHTILMGQEPNGQCGHCIAKQALKEIA